MKSYLSILHLVLVSCLAFALTGCGSGGGGSEGNPELLRIFHAAPNHAVLSFEIDDKAPASSSSSSWRWSA